MKSQKKKYEMMYILSAKLDSTKQKEKIQSINKIFTDNQIELVKNIELGLKEFAYPIKKENKGYYVVTKFSSEPKLLNVLDHYLRFDNDILRYLIIKDLMKDVDTNDKKEENITDSHSDNEKK